MILLAAAAFCLLPGCSMYDGPKFPPGTTCSIADIHPDGTSMFVVCIVPLPQEGALPNAS